MAAYFIELPNMPLWALSRGWGWLRIWRESKLLLFVPGTSTESEERYRLLMTLLRRVYTPLWHECDDLEQGFGYDEAQTRTPDEMAAEMINLVTMGNYGGGTVLPVEKSGTKVAFEGIQGPESPHAQLLCRRPNEYRRYRVRNEEETVWHEA